MYSFLQLVCMADYEKECFMVQGFSSSSAATPGSTHSEYVQEAQQGTFKYHRVFQV